MELVSIQNNNVSASEYGLDLEQLQPIKEPVEIDRAKQVYKQAKDNLSSVSESVKPSEQDIEKLAEQLNAVTESLNIKLSISVEKKGLGVIHIKMIDTETNEVIREIPPKKLSLVGSRLLDVAGLIIDKLA
jgi:flagellar protein FlaG